MNYIPEETDNQFKIIKNQKKITAADGGVTNFHYCVEKTDLFGPLNQLR